MKSIALLIVLSFATGYMSVASAAEVSSAPRISIGKFFSTNIGSGSTKPSTGGGTTKPTQPDSYKEDIDDIKNDIKDVKTDIEDINANKQDKLSTGDDYIVIKKNEISLNTKTLKQDLSDELQEGLEDQVSVVVDEKINKTLDNSWKSDLAEDVTSSVQKHLKDWLEDIEIDTPALP